MAELRQRKGETAPKDGGGEATQQSQEEERAKLVAKLQETSLTWLENLKPKPVPGTSDAAKKWKDQLLEDPFNMEAMLNLGKEYAAMRQWERCTNVLLRGFKRVSELNSANDRYDFLNLLCHASLELNRYKQALAVLNDMELTDDRDEDLQTDFRCLKCQVYGHNGDMQKCLKAFNEGLRGLKLQSALKLWTACSAALKKVDSFMVTKASLENMAETDEQKQQVAAAAMLCNMKDQYITVEEKSSFWSSTEGKISIVLIALILFAVLAGLYWLEQRSLQHWKLAK